MKARSNTPARFSGGGHAHRRTSFPKTIAWFYPEVNGRGYDLHASRWEKVFHESVDYESERKLGCRGASIAAETS